MEQKKELNFINPYNEKGKPHGYWEDYHDNGKLYFKGNYLNGDRHGYWEGYYSNGKLGYKGNYVNGKEHGYWEDYYSNGKLCYKGYYDMGKKVDYNPDEVTELTLDEIASKFGIPINQLKIKKTFVCFRKRFYLCCINLTKHKMEQKKELNFINLYNEKGEKHGYWEDYYSNGELMYKGNYVDGKEHGYWEYYYYNGKLWHKGNYVDGKEHGYWEKYYYNGKLLYKGNYVDGKQHGYWEEYHSNGKLLYKGYYDMGKKVDYNPDEVTELTLDEIASKFGIPINQLKIKK